MNRDDYEYYDCIVAMDNANIRNIHRICGGDPAQKVSRLLDFTDTPGEVADPWYSGNFDLTWRDVNNGCEALLATII
jgi:protein-tyrosine phosphatase